jgi:hypothetical protein
MSKSIVSYPYRHTVVFNDGSYRPVFDTAYAEGVDADQIAYILRVRQWNINYLLSNPQFIDDFKAQVHELKSKA